MARTAVVNKRRRKRRSSSTKRRRRRNYGAASANPARRRRRRNNPAPARRRSNPRRRKNPSPFDFDSLMDTIPAATGGVWAGRWATKLAGDFEPNDKGIPEPGFKHAVAIALAASVGGDMIGNILGSPSKGEYARIACLGFGGDLFLRKRFMRDSEFVSENLSLAGIGYDEEDEWDYEAEGGDMDGLGAEYAEGPDGTLYQLDGFQNTSAIGHGHMGNVNTFTDAVGNRYVMTQSGWQLAGAVGSPTYPNNYATIMESVAGFQNSSALGMEPTRPHSANSFGYGN